MLFGLLGIFSGFIPSYVERSVGWFFDDWRVSWHAFWKDAQVYLDKMENFWCLAPILFIPWASHPTKTSCPTWAALQKLKTMLVESTFWSLGFQAEQVWIVEWLSVAKYVAIILLHGPKILTIQIHSRWAWKVETFCSWGSVTPQTYTFPAWSMRVTVWPWPVDISTWLTRLAALMATLFNIFNWTLRVLGVVGFMIWWDWKHVKSLWNVMKHPNLYWGMIWNDGKAVRFRSWSQCRAKWI